MKKSIYILLLLGLYLHAIDVKLDTSVVANGKTVFLEFKNIKDAKVKFLDKSYNIYKHPTKDETFYAIIPVSYYQKAKDEKVYISYKDSQKEKNIHLNLSVVDGNYKKEQLKVDRSKVSLNEKDKKRAAIEYKEAMDVYNTITDGSYISSKFVMPIDSKITSTFGKARVFNDTFKSYHSGTDFRAKVGVPIKASNDGVVVLAKDRFYSGGSIVIDHGQGIYTCYFHMSKYDVKKGDKVTKSQIIGLSGDSGRVTGPHLHFSARVCGIQVDPLQLISLVNKKLFDKEKK